MDFLPGRDRRSVQHRRRGAQCGAFASRQPDAQVWRRQRGLLPRICSAMPSSPACCNRIRGISAGPPGAVSAARRAFAEPHCRGPAGLRPGRIGSSRNARYRTGRWGGPPGLRGSSRTRSSRDGPTWTSAAGLESYPTSKRLYSITSSRSLASTWRPGCTSTCVTFPPIGA